MSDGAPASCGLWATPRRLIAVVVSNDGRIERRLVITPTHDALWAFTTWLSPQRIPIVASEALRGLDDVRVAAATNDVELRVAPRNLVAALRRVAGLRGNAPKTSAALLARLHITPLLRPHLRTTYQPPRGEQLPLL